MNLYFVKDGESNLLRDPEAIRAGWAHFFRTLINPRSDEINRVQPKVLDGRPCMYTGGAAKGARGEVRAASDDEQRGGGTRRRSCQVAIAWPQVSTRNLDGSLRPHRVRLVGKRGTSEVEGSRHQYAVEDE